MSDKLSIPVFKLQITDLHGNVVASRFGAEKLEVEFLERLVEKLEDHRLGFFTSRTKVLKAIIKSSNEIFAELKNKSILAHRGRPL